MLPADHDDDAVAAEAPGGVRIRSFVEADHAAVCELFVDAMLGSYCAGETNAALRNHVNRSLLLDMADVEGAYFHSGGHFWVATTTTSETGDERVVGLVALRGREENRGELRRLCVHADFRRRGVARQLVARLEAWAADRGFDAVFLTVGSEMAPALDLYNALGYAKYQQVPVVGNAKTSLISFEKKLHA